MKKKKTILHDKERALVDLTLGHRKPRNAFERRLLKDIEKVKKQGYEVQTPNEFL